MIKTFKPQFLYLQLLFNILHYLFLFTFPPPFCPCVSVYHTFFHCMSIHFFFACLLLSWSLRSALSSEELSLTEHRHGQILQISLLFFMGFLSGFLVRSGRESSRGKIVLAVLFSFPPRHTLSHRQLLFLHSKNAGLFTYTVSGFSRWVVFLGYVICSSLWVNNKT